ncbi:MAG: Na/Pi cotransporter family protein [Bacteroidetes bacterium]|nr:MAG: Na/Pi cotransporter family protein [Bacteroidota bacterium]REJ99989.1 MAG: Na/Pi cotransporter family protein [Bacteroidota bacterium]REK35831.1 MAG: Na/Pi cotransporter family protein [Bacteroidota bacterium]REK49298.1 MAG: Na/Pi cotransporter family protein [Bacteroidota bacterium]
MTWELWKFLAGLGFFLFSMSMLENRLKNVSGRSVKLFLKRNTQNLFKAIAGGAIVTGIVQSSSVVSLIVLAFVESGIITFRNALGVILGTNLGTTLDSWIVATVGFKLNILRYSLPLISLTAIGMFFSEKSKRLFNFFSIFFAIGVLFLGLSYMKDSALVLVRDFNIAAFNQYGTFVFVIIGFILTTIIQSSSATVAITLTAIYSGMLTFPSAAAVVIGSEVGTTIKILLWGMTGTSDKKRVAFGNFIYNIITAITAYAGLKWIIFFIENYLGIKDPLIGLVAFQTTINLIAIAIFVPILSRFATWLESKFIHEAQNGFSFISEKEPFMPALAIHALRNESTALLKKTLQLTGLILCRAEMHKNGFLENLRSATKRKLNEDEEYKKLKQSEGDILSYYARIQENNLSPEDVTALQKIINSVRQSVYAAKAVMDISHNINEFESSINDLIHGQNLSISKSWNLFISEMESLIRNGLISPERISDEISRAAVMESEAKGETIRLLKGGQLTEFEASTLLNVQKELYSCKKSLLLAVSNLQAENTSHSGLAGEMTYHE